ncbi:MAG TPA: glycosyltransferase family 9 protein [Bacteroidota bacterium]|nr:glycosyltransferase family 9 protein [Bacteroidota bacterium]
MSKRTFENALIVRTDRIGDVVLTLPMIPVLRESLPGIRISMLLRSYTAALVEGTPGLDHVVPYDRSGKPKEFLALLSELQAQKFDLVIVSHPTLRIALLTALAGIPVRVGSGYRWYSFLFNRKVFEHRKTAEKHEAAYNISLLQAIDIRSDSIPRIELSLPSSANDAAAVEVRRLGLSEIDRFVVLHPGSGGSARDWNPRNFGVLAAALVGEGLKVVVTGSTEERRLVEAVVEASGGKAMQSVGMMPLKVLAAFIGRAHLFVSNSTGPLHIAAAVGTPVIAFYPPIRECSPRRWGPLTDDQVVFTAVSSLCPRCNGGPCQGNDCMEQISVEDVLGAAHTLLTPKERSY